MNKKILPLLDMAAFIGQTCSCIIKSMLPTSLVTKIYFFRFTNPHTLFEIPIDELTFNPPVSIYLPSIDFIFYFTFVGHLDEMKKAIKLHYLVMFYRQIDVGDHDDMAKYELQLQTQNLYSFISFRILSYSQHFALHYEFFEIYIIIRNNYVLCM